MDKDKVTEVENPSWKPSKVLQNRYSNKMVDSRFYGIVEVKKVDSEVKYLTAEEVKAGKSGYFLMPYLPLVTHVSINGKRIRQVSRWFLFKMWFRKMLDNLGW